MDDQRSIGLLGATGVGVGAIVGGGILVLAGAAFAHTGPAAMVAFGLNGVIAVLTARSVIEVAVRFPESGGAYHFAKKVFSVRAAFAAGWIVWFAYIGAGVLYALGFSTYALEGLAALWRATGGEPPAWLTGHGAQLVGAIGATIVYALTLGRSGAGSDRWATWGKVALFVVIIAFGAVATVTSEPAHIGAALTPFFSSGLGGLAAAMGITFIALQGFEIIAAIASEIREPQRTIPRAMTLALAIALAIYLPLLFVIATAGVAPGENIHGMAEASPDTLMAVATGRFMGAAGYWLIIAVAVLSTLSALRANLLAASRVAFAMARDRTLPEAIAVVHHKTRAPTVSIWTSALILVAILLVVPNLEAAGSAASLVFLLSFTLAHITAQLVRRRSGTGRAGRWLSVPIVGGAACAGLATFQAIAVPEAGGITLLWLGVGGLLYLSLFAGRAEARDAAAEALDPSLIQLRGRAPLVLVPVANPANAVSFVSVANAMAPRGIGRVLLMSVVTREDSAVDDEVARRLGDAQDVIRQAMLSSFASGHSPEALVTAAPAAWAEIQRVAEEHRCQSVLLGTGLLAKAEGRARVEDLVNALDCDVALMNTPPGWQLESTRRILVPVGGRGEQHGLRARLLGSLARAGARHVTFLHVASPRESEADVRAARRRLTDLANEGWHDSTSTIAGTTEDPAGFILEAAQDHDLLVLGLGRGPERRTAIGDLARRLAAECPCATILLSSRPEVLKQLNAADALASAVARWRQHLAKSRRT